MQSIQSNSSSSDGASSSPIIDLLHLPSELLDQILRHLPKNDLSRLALVNSVCHQLARPRIFDSVSLTCDEERYNAPRRMTLLLQHLCKDLEATVPHEPSPRETLTLKTGHNDIGFHIRSLQLSCFSTWPLDIIKYDTASPEKTENLSPPTQSALARIKRGEPWALFMWELTFLLNNITIAMPNLRCIDLNSIRDVRPDILNAIRDTETITDVSLDSCRIPHPFMLLDSFSDITTSVAATSAFKIAPNPWRLRNLYLNILADRRTGEDFSSELLSLGIVTACAATLETLTWSDSQTDLLRSRNIQLMPEFPRLRKVKLEFLKFDTPTLLDRIMHDRLTHLELWNLLPTRAAMPFLQILVISGRPPSAEVEATLLSFLRTNCWLRKLDIKVVSSPSFHERLLPVLESSYTKLTSLGLTWSNNCIPTTSLEAIGQLGTLQQLRLCVGIMWDARWAVDHHELQTQLSGLLMLRRLALQCDAYVDPNSPVPLNRYHDAHHRYSQEDLANFEAEHCQAMVQHAGGYAERLPRLEWIYIGRVPISITTSLIGQRIPVALSEKRKMLWAVLANMFGWRNPLDVEDCGR